MALNSFQLLTRVLPGQPFGDGADGAYSSATAPTMTKDSCSGTATTTTLTTTGSTFANGDILKLVQMRGTGVGQWEIVKVASGGGSTSLTLSTALQYTYTDSGASQAQAIKIFRYTDVTVQSGTWTPPAWDGNVGGILTFAANGTVTPTGTINVGGTNGGTSSIGLGGSYAGATGGGYRGGTSRSSYANQQSDQGEGSAAASSQSQSANGSGSGGSYTPQSFSKRGSGGSHATQGDLGSGGGVQGSTVGDTNLQALFMGAGGSGCSNGANNTYWFGQAASGGGIFSMFAKTILSPTNIFSKGGNGGDGDFENDGGSGAGGSILICGGTVDIGTDKLSVIGGSSVVNGGKGRIAVYYGTSLAGTISSSLYGSYTNAQDGSLVESGGASSANYAFFM